MSIEPSGPSGENHLSRQTLLRARQDATLLLNLIVDSLPSIVWFYDTAGQQFVNRAFNSFTGLPVADMRGDRLQTLIHPEDAQAYHDTFQACLRERRPFDAQVRMRRDDGQWRWMISRGAPCVSATGEYLGYAGVSIDISEQKQTERQLHEKEAQFRSAAAAGGIGTYSRNLQTGKDDWSPEFLEICGLPPDEPLAPKHGITAMVDPQNHENLLDQLRARLDRSGEPDFTGKHRLILPDGRIRWVLMRGRMDFDEHGRPLRSQGIVIDITERKQDQANERLEQLVLERTAKLTQTIETLHREVAQREQAQARLKHASEQLTLRTGQVRELTGELTIAEQRERKRLAKVLHDGLQQYLVSAKMQLDGIAAAYDDDALKLRIDEIKTILAESIKLSRNLSIDLSPQALYESGLTGALEWLAGQMHKRFNFKVMLTLDATPELPPDATITVFEAVRELLFNAFKHSGVAEAQVSLQLSHDPWIRIAVSDQGVGFDPVLLKSNNVEAEGTGLFSIHLRLGLIGGQFLIESNPGKGCRFTLLVPKQKETPPL